MTNPSSPWRPGGRLLAFLVLLLVAVAGGFAGVAIDRRVLLPRKFEGHRFEHGPGPHGARDRGFRNRFARELGLSPEQQTRIDSIMERQGRELRTIRHQVQPQPHPTTARRSAYAGAAKEGGGDPAEAPTPAWAAPGRRSTS